MSNAPLTRHLVYWILPSAVTLLCSIVYFLNVFGAAEIIAPDVKREFGLLENLQIVLLLVILCLCVKRFRKSTVKREQYVFCY